MDSPSLRLLIKNASNLVLSPKGTSFGAQGEEGIRFERLAPEFLAQSPWGLQGWFAERRSMPTWRQAFAASGIIRRSIADRH